MVHATCMLLLLALTPNSTTTVAQIPSSPPPSADSFTTDSQAPQLLPLRRTHPPSIPPPTIQITSPQDGQRVPVGELTIQGISSDDKESNCRVYADVNDITPMRNVSGIDYGDHSRWNFKYTEDYQLITPGSNEITAKISCYAPDNPAPLSEWHTVNVTGVTSQTETRSVEGSTTDIDEDEDENEDGD